MAVKVSRIYIVYFTETFSSELWTYLCLHLTEWNTAALHEVALLGTLITTEGAYEVFETPIVRKGMTKTIHIFLNRRI